MHAVRLLEEGGSQGMGAWFVLIVLAIFAVMVFLGWLAYNKGWLKKEEEVKPEVHETHVQVPAAPIPAPAPVRSVAVDDLTVLEGIGPKVAALLAGIGITNFESLAQADFGSIRTALDAAGYKYMDPAGWIEQAALAAKGETEALKKLQDSLKGGRKVS